MVNAELGNNMERKKKKKFLKNLRNRAQVCNLRQLHRSKKIIKKSSLSAKWSALEKWIHLCESNQLYNRFIIQLIIVYLPFWIGWPIKTSNQNYFRSIYQKNLRKKFVIEYKLSLLDRRDKSVHYPESPKVTSLPQACNFQHTFCHPFCEHRIIICHVNKNGSKYVFIFSAYSFVLFSHGMLASLWHFFWYQNDVKFCTIFVSFCEPEIQK